MTFPFIIPESLAILRSPFHTHMIVVIGTITIFLTGIIISKLWNKIKPHDIT
jgi:SSS family solute:Na+ symporter